MNAQRGGDPADPRRAALRRAGAALAALALACASSGGPWAWWHPDGEPVQWSLFGDQTCSGGAPDLAPACCAEHDLAYAAGGTEQDRLTADLELAACMALYGVPEETVALYFRAVREGGASSWRYSEHRTRGPPR